MTQCAVINPRRATESASQSRIGGIRSTETCCDESEDPADLAGCPWQNPYVERLIDTVCRECLDQMLIFGEAHLRHILSGYVKYYNEVRTHRALPQGGQSSGPAPSSPPKGIFLEERPVPR